MLPLEGSALSSRKESDLVVDDELGVVRPTGFSMSTSALEKVPSNGIAFWWF